MPFKQMKFSRLTFLYKVRLKNYSCFIRVPGECPQMLVDLYLACTSFEAEKRPSAVQILQAIEEAMLAIPCVTQS